MMVNVRALTTNNPPRHRCARSLRGHFPTPYNSPESELERNLMIRTTAGPNTTYRHPPASRGAERKG
jgi:hypothetical protein